MAFSPEDDELDWGDVVDVVSLGDEDEIPCIAAVEENKSEDTAHSRSAQEEDFEPAPVSAQSPPVAAFSHPLGLSHLPPKPQPVLHHRRSRETIKASSMSRAYPRANSPGPAEDLPRHWEVRRTETVIYYYHTEFRCSQLKRPTRDDARPDKFHWKGDEPPSGSGRSQSARNPASVRTGPAEWPERSALDHQNRSSARDKSPRRASPPRQRSPQPSRMRSNSTQQPAAARAMSPSSMLLPRRGASPARGLAKSNSNPQRSDPDIGISSDPQDSRSGRLRASGWEQRGRHNARERGSTRSNGGTDHYSPPPEAGDSPPQRGSRHRSISPLRKAPMRSDAMIINQHTRRSLSPRDRDDSRGYERPPFDRMPSDNRYGREYPIDMRRGGGEYPDPREDRFRTTNGRAPNQYPSGPESVSPHPRDSASFSPHPEDTGYTAPPPGNFREAPFGGRSENRRVQSSRSANVRSSRVEPQEGEPRLSPVALRNEVPLPPRHEFAPPHDGTPSRRRARNDNIRSRMIPEDHAPPMDHESIPLPHGERDRHPDIRQGEPVRRHGHRHSVSGEDYLPHHSHSPQTTRERDLPDASPPRHSYTGRPHDFPPQDLAEPRESDFRLRDREPEHYPPKERREQHEPYPRGLRQEDPIPHVYEASSVPHARRMVPRDAEALPGRIYSQVEPQQAPPPAPPVREGYPRRYVRDDQFSERPPRGWEREEEGPAPPEEARHVGPKPQQGSRRVQREVASDPEYIEPRDDGRPNRHGRGQSRFDKPGTEGRPGFKRRATRDDNQQYEPEDRQWTPRNAPPPLPRPRSPVAQMEVDAPPVPLPEKQLAGWANFRRHRERSPERREPYRSRPGARDSWHPPPNEGQDLEVEGSKRQRIEDGSRPTQSFNHRQEDLPRKIPQHSPTQRPKMRSPNNSFSILPAPALVIQPPVDLQAAITRAKDVASQLTQANPQHKPRPKSRFDQPSDSTGEREINRGLLVPNDSSGAFGGVNALETASSETNERSSPDVVNDGRQGSEGSHSSHIVSRMDEASLRDNGYPQRRPERHRDSRQDNGAQRRDRNRSDNHRNGGRNNGEKSQKFIDSYRPGDETPGQGAGGMRAWGKPDVEPQREPPPHTSALSTNRTYRDAGDRVFARPPQIITVPEGLPPRPPTPTEFARGARNRGQTAGQARSPPGQGGRSYNTIMADTDAADAATDNETDQTSAPNFSFRQASASSPRKSSLLDRMTDPASGAPLTVPPKDRGNNGNGYQQRRPKSYRTGSRR